MPQKLERRTESISAKIQNHVIATTLRDEGITYRLKTESPNPVRADVEKLQPLV